MTTFRNVKTRSTDQLKKDLKMYQGMVIQYEQIMTEAQFKLDTYEDPEVLRLAQFEMETCEGYQDDVEAYIRKIKAELKSR